MRFSGNMEFYSLSYRTGIQDYGTLFNEFPEGHRDAVDDEQHFFLSINRWSVGEDHTGFRRHAMSMCHET